MDKHMLTKVKKHSDSVLAAFGLQARRSRGQYIVPVVSLLGVGILAGAGLGLFFAPGRSGSRKVHDVGEGLKSAKTKSSPVVHSVEVTPEKSAASASTSNPGQSSSSLNSKTPMTVAGTEAHAHA